MRRRHLDRDAAANGCPRLGTPSSCTAAFDRDGDGAVAIDELIGAVDSALRGCAGAPHAGAVRLTTLD